MATAKLKPDADVSNSGWGNSDFEDPPADLYSYVDETDADYDDDDHVFNDSGSAATLVLGMAGSPANVDDVTKVEVFVRGKIEIPYEGDYLEANIKIGGSWQTAKDLEFDYGASVFAWKSVSWTGSWTKAQVDALEVKINSSYGSGLDMYAGFSALYVEITYTESSGTVRRRVIVASVAS